MSDPLSWEQINDLIAYEDHGEIAEVIRTLQYEVENLRAGLEDLARHNGIDKPTYAFPHMKAREILEPGIYDPVPSDEATEPDKSPTAPPAPGVSPDETCGWCGLWFERCAPEGAREDEVCHER